MGRTFTVPSSDAIGTGTHISATGQLNVSYSDNDMAYSQAQGAGSNAQSVSFTLDVEQDRFASRSTVVGMTSPVTTTVNNHYDSDGDSPAWTSTVVDSGPNAGSTWTAYVGDSRGNLGAVVDQSGTATLQLANLHGDVVATTPAGGTATGVIDYTESTEYGIPRTALTVKAYGWVGARQRSGDDLSGLFVMGVRLYNPATGRFLSVDPVPGGNANAYGYPEDPINSDDVTGAIGYSINTPWFRYKAKLKTHYAFRTPPCLI